MDALLVALFAWWLCGFAISLFWCFMHRTFSLTNVVSAVICGVLGPAAWLFVRKDL